MLNILMVIYFCFLPLTIIYSNPPKEKGLKIKELNVTDEKMEKDSSSNSQRLAVVVGLNEYTDKNISKLSKARYDAKLFAETIEKYGQFDQIATLTDDLDGKGLEYPNKKNIESKIDIIISKANPEDFFLFYFSGHGISDSLGRGYVLPADADTEKFVDDRLVSESAVSVEWITEKIKRKGIKRSILILDACRDNPTKGTKSAIFNDLKSDDYTKSQISAIFYSTKSGLYSYEDPDSDNGVFTKYLVEAMMGSADRANTNGSKDNVVTFSEIQEYVTQKVDAWSTKNNKLQKPFIKMNDEFTGSIPVTIYEGTPIVVKAQRERSSEALWRSALIPGWGQYHKDEYYKALGFSITTLTLMGGLATYYSSYQSSLSEYNNKANTAQAISLGTSEVGLLTLVNYGTIQSAKSDLQYATGNVSLASGLLLGVYLFNLLDAGTYRDINRQLSWNEGKEGWQIFQKREAYIGQIGYYNELGYLWKY